MKKIALVSIVVLLNFSALAADPEPYLKSAPMPFYPPLCRSARISGTVTLHFTVNEKGDTSDVNAVGGHQMLREAAIQSVQNWKFAWANPANAASRRK